MSAIRLVTFDLDNTLWNVETVLRGAERRMQAWLHETVPDYPLHISNETLMDLRGAILEESPTLTHDLSALREEILFRAIGQCGIGRAAARKLARQAFDIFLDARHEVEFFDGALATLERLSGDYVLGALTNGNADIRRLKLDRFFDFGFSSASVGVGKPAPDIFHAALRRAGVLPAQSVHVGDHLLDDVGGANAVGMHTIWVNHDGGVRPEDAALPSRTVVLLSEIPQAIDAITATER